MQLIGFNNHYKLQNLVLSGDKPMTRRLEKGMENLQEGNFCFQKGRNQIVIYGDKGTPIEIIKLRYKIGEIVAIRQAYKEIADNPFFTQQCAANGKRVKDMECEAGWDNKMFVSAYYMPHHIQFTDAKIERLQGISDEDCLKEGVYMRTEKHPRQEFEPEYTFGEGKYHAQNPIAAFACLIDKVSGKGTWLQNSFVVAYSFKRID